MIKQHASGMHRGWSWRIITDDYGGGYAWEYASDADSWFRSKRSQGRFYDQAPDHPEGGVAWATNSVLKILDDLPDRSARRCPHRA